MRKDSILGHFSRNCRMGVEVVRVVRAEVRREDAGQRAGQKAEGRDDEARQRSEEQKELREMDRARKSAQTSDGKRLAVRRGTGEGQARAEGQRGRMRVRRARQMAEVRGTERAAHLEL